MPSLEVDGFEVIPGVVGEDVCSDLVSKLPAADVGTRILLEEPKFVAIARFLRDTSCLRSRLNGLVAVQAILFRKTRQNNWSLQRHRDTVLPIGGTGPWKPAGIKEGLMYQHAPSDVLGGSVAVRLSLDEVPEGDINVVPGSHILNHPSEEVEPEPVVVPRGGALLMRPTTIHGSAKLVASRARRVLHFLFGPPELPFNYRWHHAL